MVKVGLKEQIINMREFPGILKAINYKSNNIKIKGNKHNRKSLI